MNRSEIKQKTDEFIEFLLNLSQNHLKQRPGLTPKLKGMIYNKLKIIDKERIIQAFAVAGNSDINYSFASLTIAQKATSNIEMLASQFKPVSSQSIQPNKHNPYNQPIESLEVVRKRIEKRKLEWYADPKYPVFL